MTRAAFHRETPDARRQSLIEATARCLARLGTGGTSVRAICAEAGVSAGLLRHYFEGVDALVMATYAHVGDHVADTLEAAVEAAGDDPRARLDAYVTASFRPPIADPALLSTWLAFWSLVKTDPVIAAHHAAVYGDSRARMEALIADCLPDPGAADVRLAAVAITALVDGLWLELCLDPTTFSATEAAAITRRWVDTLVAEPGFGR